MSSMGFPLPVVIEKDGKSEKAYDLYSRLLKDRIVFIGTPIDDQVANAIIAQLLFLESDDPDKDINIYINSPGGNATSGLGIYDTMCYVKPDVRTFCVGQAVSLGCFLLAGGTKGKRYSLPHSRIMMHQMQGGPGHGNAPDVDVGYAEFKYLNDVILGIFAENTGHSLEEIKEAYARNWWMGPEEARGFGILDAIHEKSPRESNE